MKAQKIESFFPKIVLQKNIKKFQKSVDKCGSRCYNTIRKKQKTKNKKEKREETKMYKVYERITRDHKVLRMVTDDKEQAETFASYLRSYYKRVWIETEE